MNVGSKRIGEILEEMHLITGDQLVIALKKQKQTKKLLGLAKTATENSYKIHEGTIQDLRDQGCSDEEIFEAIAVVSLFSFMDRMADALGAPVEGMQEMVSQMQNQ